MGWFGRAPPDPPVSVTANLPDYRANRRSPVEVGHGASRGRRIQLEQPASKILVGQQVRLAGKVYSIHGEPRTDAIVWRDIVDYGHGANGKLMGVAAGQGDGNRHGRVSATASSTSRSWRPMWGLIAADAVCRSRTIPVMSFASSWKYATKPTRAINGLTPTYSFTPARA